MLVVCLNPAVDVTYHVPRLAAGETYAVTDVCTRAGGKGVNAARVLHQLGEPVTLTGFTADGLPHIDGVASRLVPAEGRVRTTVTVVDGTGRATVFREPGPAVGAGDWARLMDLFTDSLADAGVALLSGSVPPGAPVDAYAQLTRLAHAAGVPVVLDAAGDPLRAALAAAPDVVKPNRAEAADYGADPVAGLVAAGARGAVVSDGPAGCTAHLDGWRYTVRLPEAIAGNPTGAGDALAAGLARGLRDGRPWPEVLRDAAALAAGAVAVPYAGAYDASVAARIRPLLEVL